MIIDCFPFCNELELLEIRLETLAPVVDGFVLVEAGQTYSGKTKELWFQKNQSLFERFAIHSISIPTFPADVTDPWQREAYTRNRLAEGVGAFSPASSDCILLSDVDEIPRPELVRTHAGLLAQEPPGACYVFSQELSYYFVNCSTAEPWHGTRMIRYGDITTLSALRGSAGTIIPDGGWHFSYLGGAERIREKIQAAVHTELDLPQHTDPDHVARCLADGADLFGRNLAFRTAAFGEDFPPYLVQNQERFAHLIKLCVENESPKSGSVRDESARDEAMDDRIKTCLPPHIDDAPANLNDTPAEGLFRRAASTPSDIHQHLDYLYRLASTVSHITEMGTRSGHSSSAFLYAKPDRLLCYDIERSPDITALEEAASASGVAFEFRQEDVLATEIEPTDLLFIDTWHVETQMREELRRHADKARRYLVLHDTETFAHQGESSGHRGIWRAVAEFMRSSPHWRLLQHFPYNNGLTVFQRL